MIFCIIIKEECLTTEYRWSRLQINVSNTNRVTALYHLVLGGFKVNVNGWFMIIFNQIATSQKSKLKTNLTSSSDDKNKAKQRRQRENESAPQQTHDRHLRSLCLCTVIRFAYSTVLHSAISASKMAHHTASEQQSNVETQSIDITSASGLWLQWLWQWQWAVYMDWEWHHKRPTDKLIWGIHSKIHRSCTEQWYNIQWWDSEVVVVSAVALILKLIFGLRLKLNLQFIFIIDMECREGLYSEWVGCIHIIQRERGNIINNNNLEMRIWKKIKSNKNG